MSSKLRSLQISFQHFVTFIVFASVFLSHDIFSESDHRETGSKDSEETIELTISVACLPI